MKILIILLLTFLALNNKVIQKMEKTVRGVRNKNPMNLRISANAWNGKVQGDDKSFETFASVEYGIRAGAKTLITYQERHGLNTVNEIINRFAPPFENDTNSYAVHVASVLGVGLDEPIDVKQNLFPLVSSIIKHENGFNPYSEETIKNGIALV